MWDLSDDMLQLVDDGSILDNVDKLTNEDLTTRVVDGPWASMFRCRAYRPTSRGSTSRTGSPGNSTLKPIRHLLAAAETAAPFLLGRGPSLLAGGTCPDTSSHLKFR